MWISVGKMNRQTHERCCNYQTYFTTAYKTFFIVIKSKMTLMLLAPRSLFEVVCTVHHLIICIQTNKMHKIIVIRLHFLLDALHVSDYISPSAGATFISCTSHLVCADTCGCYVTIAT